MRLYESFLEFCATASSGPLAASPPPSRSPKPFPMIQSTAAISSEESPFRRRFRGNSLLPPQISVSRFLDLEISRSSPRAKLGRNTTAGVAILTHFHPSGAFSPAPTSRSTIIPVLACTRYSSSLIIPKRRISFLRYLVAMRFPNWPFLLNLASIQSCNSSSPTTIPLSEEKSRNLLGSSAPLNSNTSRSEGKLVFDVEISDSTTA